MSKRNDNKTIIDIAVFYSFLAAFVAVKYAVTHRSKIQCTANNTLPIAGCLIPQHDLEMRA